MVMEIKELTPTYICTYYTYTYVVYKHPHTHIPTEALHTFMYEMSTD